MHGRGIEDTYGLAELWGQLLTLYSRESTHLVILSVGVVENVDRDLQVSSSTDSASRGVVLRRVAQHHRPPSSNTYMTKRLDLSVERVELRLVLVLERLIRLTTADH